MKCNKTVLLCFIYMDFVEGVVYAFTTDAQNFSAWPCLTEAHSIKRKLALVNFYICGLHEIVILDDKEVCFSKVDMFRGLQLLIIIVPWHDIATKTQLLREY